MKRCGAIVGAVADEAVEGGERWRPFPRMSTTSIAMQPAMLNASVCTGEGPAVLSPSSAISAVPLDARKLQVSVPDQR